MDIGKEYVETNHANAQIEEDFHDQWASSINLDDLDIYAAFTAATTPEFQYALTSLGDIKNKSLLEIGCGPGEASLFLASKGAQVTAIDISSGMISIAEKLSKRFHFDNPSPKFIKMSSEDLQFPDNSFDLVYGSNIMHHCDIDLACKEISRVLKPNGCAVFVDPLGYNPVINIYRRIAYKVRTSSEHPLLFSDIKIMQNHFSRVSHQEFQLMTLAIFIWFLIGERIHPSNERYWRKFVLEADRYEHAFRTLRKIDIFLLNRVPFLNRYCWNIVVVCNK